MTLLRQIGFLLLVWLLTSALAGCEDSRYKEEVKTDRITTDSTVTKKEASDEHPLKGKSIEISILGISEWYPSELIGKIALQFSDYAKQTYGYQVNVSFAGSSVWTLFDKVCATLSTGSQQFNIFVIDSQWIGALAVNGWIVPVNELIESYPELNIDWWDPIIPQAYSEYPIGSGIRWGFPQETDVIALFVRKDLFTNLSERTAFKSKYKMDLPRTFEDFQHLSMQEFEKIAEFFTRPEKGLYGTVMQYAKTYDFMTMYLYPFMFSLGGKIWDPKDQRIYGVLNSDVNARAMRWNRRMLAYQPPDSIHYGISENLDAFTQGKVATAFQWAAMGMAMITAENKDQVLVVPPPGFRQKNGSLRRIYTIGGQPWVINAFNDEDHMRAAIDFLKWWYLPEIQLEFARNGGNPAVKATMNSPGFDELQPWFTTLKYMLHSQRSNDFWHHPKYAELLEVQQEVFTAYAAGKIDDPELALEYIACRQQKILFEYGSSKHSPPESCNNALLKEIGTD